MAGGLPRKKPQTEGNMAKIVKSVYGGGIVYEISRYSEEKKRLDEECKKLEAYGSEKITYPEKIMYYLPIIKK